MTFYEVFTGKNMIEFDYKEKQGIIICDKCNEEHIFDGDDFYHFLEEAKHYGWQNKKVFNKWENLCPNCAREKHD